MNGKQFKEFAAKLHDDAEIHVEGRFRSGWTKLEARDLRAVHTIVPDIEPVQEDEACRS